MTYAEIDAAGRYYDAMFSEPDDCEDSEMDDEGWFGDDDDDDYDY